jgi:glyoxylase-like metal-dependent hydrolase (beta-lactamase superfamily II)
LTHRSSILGVVKQERQERQEKQPASSEVTEVGPGILRMQLPISMPGLGHVNCYALQDERGVAIVDPGLPGPQSWRALVDRLGKAGYKPKHVHTVVVTHSHPDHFGGAGKLRHDVGADIVSHTTFRTWFNPSEDEDVDADSPTPARSPWEQKVPWSSTATFKPPIKRRLKYTAFRPLMKRWLHTPTPSIRLADADVITLAGREWVALHTPGHTPDHLCLYDAAEGIVLSGDHVLPTITPHISGLHAGEDPLTAFFTSLDRMTTLEGVTQVLPAHGHPFADLATRAEEIRLHHVERLGTLKSASAEIGGPASVHDLMQHLFRERSWGPMAESETYAHLEHLRLTGAAERIEEADRFLYEVTG